MEPVAKPHQESDSQPQFQVGDTVRVEFRLLEAKTERTQSYEGVVIAFKSKGSQRTFTVRKVVAGVGTERIFPLYSPNITGIRVVQRGKVRREKLYYLRHKVGKKAKVRIDFSRPV